MHILSNQSQPLYSYFSMYNVHALLNLFSGVLRFSPLETSVPIALEAIKRKDKKLQTDFHFPR
jgi:hypothetical protein